MAKIKFKTDTLLTIVQDIFSAEEVDTVVTGAHRIYKGKKLGEILNAHYYAFKHKIFSVGEKVERMKEQDPDLREGILNFYRQSYCLVTVDETERLFSKDVDKLQADGTLEYWIQTEKVKFLEELIENANLYACGRKLDVQIGDETRKCTAVFTLRNVSGMDDTELGETQIATVGVTLLLEPAYACYSDYTVSFAVGEQNVPLPLVRLSMDGAMVSKSIPLASVPSCVNNLNLSHTTVFTLEFNADADNAAAEMFVSDAFSRGAENHAAADINKTYAMTLTRREKHYFYSVRMTQFKTQVENSLENETCIVVLSTGKETGGA